MLSFNFFRQSAYNGMYPVQAVLHSSGQGDTMTVCIAEMPSYTYAVKGEKLLRARGYPCEIKRNELPGGGCGFSLIIKGGCPEALDILRAYSVPYTNVRGGGTDDAGKL